MVCPASYLEVCQVGWSADHACIFSHRLSLWANWKSLEEIERMTLSALCFNKVALATVFGTLENSMRRRIDTIRKLLHQVIWVKISRRLQGDWVHAKICLRLPRVPTWMHLYINRSLFRPVPPIPSISVFSNDLSGSLCTGWRRFCCY